MDLNADDSMCFICGQLNPIGLKIKFDVDEDNLKIEGSFVPRSEHQGYTGIMHGGLVCALLDEAMVNAVVHGNDSDPEKNVTVQIFSSKTELTIWVNDEGTGFQDSDVPSSKDSDALSREHGRGVELIHYYMDKVIYYCEGSVLVMSKLKDKKE